MMLLIKEMLNICKIKFYDFNICCRFAHSKAGIQIKISFHFEYISNLQNFENYNIVNGNKYFCI